MPAPLPIRTDRDAAELRRVARRERDGRVSARLLALANALDGLPREEAARLAGMTGQTLGDWVHRKRHLTATPFRPRLQPRAARPSRPKAAAARARGPWSGPRPCAR